MDNFKAGIVDSYTTRQNKFIENLRSAGFEIVYKLSDKKLTKEGADRLQAIDVLLVHINDLFSDIKEDMTQCRNCKLIFKYSGGNFSLSSGESQSGKVFKINRSVNHDGTGVLSVDECKELKNYLAETIKELSFVKVPQHRAYLIALSILCQGYLAAHAGTDLHNKLPEKIKDTVKDKALSTEQLSFWKIIIGSDDINKEIEALSAKDAKEKDAKEKIQALVSCLKERSSRNESISIGNLSTVKDAYNAFCKLEKNGRGL